MKDEVTITKVKNGYILKVPFGNTHTLSIYSDFSDLIDNLAEYFEECQTSEKTQEVG